MFVVQKLIGLLAVALSLVVIYCNNMIYSGFCLMLVLVNVAVFFLSLELEFLGLIYLMVYVGAVLVLFLFILLSLNVKDLVVYQAFELSCRRRSIFAVIYSVFWFFNPSFLLVELITDIQLGGLFIKNYFYFLQVELADINVYGMYLYTQLMPYLIVIGLLLFIVMLGVILIVFNYAAYRRQSEYKRRWLSTLSLYQN